MNNYYNILPIILIDIFIILVFEGLVFFLYLVKQQENIISSQLGNFLALLNEKKSNITDPTQKQLLNFTITKVNNFMPLAISKEQTYNDISYKNGIIIYLTTLFIISVSLLLYNYIVVYNYRKKLQIYRCFSKRNKKRR